MNCGDYQQNILLMIHGELGFVDQVRVKAHLSRCAECRKRRDMLAAASQQIGAVIRSPGMSPWAPAKTPQLRRIPSARTIAGLTRILAAGAILTASYIRNKPAECIGETMVPAAVTSKCATCCVPDPYDGKCK